MEFLKTDYDWSDWHTGLTPERLERFALVVEACYEEVLKILWRNRARGFSTRATIPIGVFSKGTRGDGPSYTPVVLLESSRWIGYERLQRIRDEITNTCPINRVAYRIGSIPFDIIGALYRQRASLAIGEGFPDH